MDDLELTATNSIMIIGRQKRKRTEEQKGRERMKAKKYYEKHKAELNKKKLEYVKKKMQERGEYYQRAREWKRAYDKLPVLCDCGITVRRGGLNRHSKTRCHHVLLEVNSSPKSKSHC